MREDIYIIDIIDCYEIFTNTQGMKKIVKNNKRHTPMVLVPKFIYKGFERYEPVGKLFVNINNITTIAEYSRNAEIVKGDSEND